ncbi:MAG: replication factor A [Methanosarcinaceae archaeon]|nr:replication factor A [Methanosarcinaceae archaeon]
MTETAISIKDRFLELGIEVPIEDIEERLDKLANKFKVPMDEAKRSVVNYFLKEHDIARSDFYTSQDYGESPVVNVADITEDGKWVSVKGKIVQLWDNDHESISQVGLIGDESGTIKFTKWARDDFPDVEVDKCYLFSNVVSKEWNGKIEVSLNKNSSIEKIDEDIDVGTSTVNFTGAMVDIQSGSGLIKRCPECNRSLTKGACTDHGKVEGVYDLRIKAIMDNGVVTQEALLNREITEMVTGITLDDAIAMAADALDQAVVLDLIKNKLVSRYYTVTGPRLDRYILVDSIEQESQVDSALIDSLLAEVEVA